MTLRERILELATPINKKIILQIWSMPKKKRFVAKLFWITSVMELVVLYGIAIKTGPDWLSSALVWWLWIYNFLFISIIFIIIRLSQILPYIDVQMAHSFYNINPEVLERKISFNSILVGMLVAGLVSMGWYWTAGSLIYALLLGWKMTDMMIDNLLYWSQTDFIGEDIDTTEDK